MKSNYKLAFLLVFFFATGSLAAQNGINSPFSQYGIGMNNMPYNFPGFAALGGITSTRSAHNMVNPFNPASYAAIGKETLVFDMGLCIESTMLRSGDNSQHDADGNLGYLSIGFPLTKWWKTAIGVMPYSDVNYQSVQTATINPGGEVRNVYEGNGGVSQFFWGHGFNIMGGTDAMKPQLRMGFNVSLIYGNITRGITYDFVANDTTYFMNRRHQKDSYIKNFLFDFGAQYEQPLGGKYRMGAALTFKPYRKMDFTENSLVYTFISNGSSETIRDTIFPLPGGDSEYESTLEQPWTIGLGLSLQRNDKWLVAVDATLAPWNGMKYTENTDFNIFSTSPLRYDNTQRYALGLQLLGDKNSSSYFRRITFSAGVHYESGKLHLHLSDGSDHTLNEWGVGFGASLPMRKGRSVLNLTVAYSSFGNADLLRRDAYLFGISVGSCESWFVKRKFN